MSPPVLWGEAPIHYRSRNPQAGSLRSQLCTGNRVRAVGLLLAASAVRNLRRGKGDGELIACGEVGAQAGPELDSTANQSNARKV